MSQPPLLPERWSASYVSYWSPMAPADQMTSGHAWFDYPAQRFRIDGLFNPWDEVGTGHRLWMSEVGLYGRGETYRLSVEYWLREKRYTPEASCWAKSPLGRSLVPQDILVTNRAVRVPTAHLPGPATDAWQFRGTPDHGPTTYIIERASGRLRRMISGNPDGHASIRDFFNISTLSIPDALFDEPLQTAIEAG